MTTVVQFEHHGLACAIPAAQARAIDVRVPAGSLTSLWEGRQQVDHLRAIEAKTSGEDIWIGCMKPQLVDLPASEAIALLPVLRRILASLPHVVGMATIEGENTWLVDVTRLACAPASAEAGR